MTYQIARNGAQLGEFSEEQIRAGLRDGSILETDLAWCEGMATWERVSEVVAHGPPQGRAAPPMAPKLPSKASGLATWSLVLGIASFVASCLTGIPAIICGHMALSRIRRSGGSERGGGKATAGLIMGYLTTVGIIPIAILASLAVPTFSKVQEKANQAKAMNNARQVITTLKIYAVDHDGKYPDKLKDGSLAPDSNTAFRQVFIGEMVTEERIFGCPLSPYVPDGNIGVAPDYREALDTGENHWAMTGGINDLTTSAMPVVYENTSPGAAWPPTWNTKISGQPLPGRAWSGGKIIVGFNDGSVQLMRLESGPSEHAGLKSGLDGTPALPPGSENLRVLNPR